MIPNGTKNAGDMDREELDVERDYGVPIYLYQLLAGSDYAARNNLGHCYRYDNGVELDLDKAF